jgi:hypothetical protein
MSPRRIIGEPYWRRQGVAFVRYLGSPRRDEPRGGVHPNSARNEGAFHAFRVPTREAAKLPQAQALPSSVKPTGAL